MVRIFQLQHSVATRDAENVYRATLLIHIGTAIKFCIDGPIAF